MVFAGLRLHSSVHPGRSELPGWVGPKTRLTNYRASISARRTEVAIAGRQASAHPCHASASRGHGRGVRKGHPQALGTNADLPLLLPCGLPRRPASPVSQASGGFALLLFLRESKLGGS